MGLYLLIEDEIKKKKEVRRLRNRRCRLERHRRLERDAQKKWTLQTPSKKVVAIFKTPTNLNNMLVNSLR